MKNVSLRVALLSSSVLSVLAFSPSAVMAQDLGKPADAADPANTTPGTAATDESDADTIVVTGSRIAQPETALSNPVTTVSAQDIVQSGTTNLTDYLKTVPALVGSLSSYNNSGSRADIGFTGLNLLDLRNLGYDRTLVLIDGRRQVASVDGLQSVDINTIPSDLIERVDVLTGGASAIYGADGVSGVVNFIQKKDFEGVTARAQNGISGQGDAGQRLVAITAGHNFNDGKGNIAIAWEHSEEDRLENRDRKRLRGSNQVGFYLNPDDTETGTQNNDGIPDRIPLRDVRYGDTSRDGAIDIDFDGVPEFHGQGLPFDFGTEIPGGYQQGGSATLVSDYGNDLLPKINRDIVSFVGHYDYTPWLTLYGEAKYAHSKSYSLGQPTFDYYLFIPEDNPYIPANVRAAIDPDIGGVLVTRDNFDLGQRGEDITRETVRTVLGARGDITDNLKYDLSWVYGRTKVTNHYIGDIYDDRFLAAIDAVQGPNGITCRVNVDPTWTPNQPLSDFGTRDIIPPTTFSPGQCVPLNLFGEGQSSAEALNFIRTDTTDRSRLTQNVVSGSLTGDSGAVFKLPGGPIAFAVGGEYRRETSRFEPDAIAAQGLTFTNALGATSGKFDVWEAFAELNVPVLSDVPFAYRLNFDAAYRYSDYSTIGTTEAWKVGGNYAPVRDLTIRGTYSKAVRAPNISELFGARSQTFQFIDDPCGSDFLQNGTQYRAANCKALLSNLGVTDPANYNDTRTVNISGFNGGNPDLREETAKTWTAGLVIQPSFLPRLTVTADWYDIRIKNAINTVDVQTVADLCVDQPTVDNQYCAAISRANGGLNPGYINGFTVGPLNVANFKTAGLDVTVNYRLPTAKVGTFSVSLDGNYLHRLTFVPIPGSDAVNNAGQSAAPLSPKYQATADLAWTLGGFGLNWRLNYFSKTYRATRQTSASNPDIYAPEYFKFKERFTSDVYVSQEVADNFQLYGGVNNVFNKKPDIGAANTPVSSVGRFLFVGAKIALPDLFQ